MEILDLLLPCIILEFVHHWVPAICNVSVQMTRAEQQRLQEGILKSEAGIIENQLCRHY
jgi:hypothetical protein